MTIDAQPHIADSLTKNQSLVLSALSNAAGPLSAYDILDALRDEGLRAPLQVYRALDKLLVLGAVHRLESLNAFVVCQHGQCRQALGAVFTICDNCTQVEELPHGKLDRPLQNLVSEAEFSLRKSTVELRGVCAACSAQEKLQ